VATWTCATFVAGSVDRDIGAAAPRSACSIAPGDPLRFAAKADPFATLRTPFAGLTSPAI